MKAVRFLGGVRVLGMGCLLALGLGRLAAAGPAGGCWKDLAAGLVRGDPITLMLFDGIRVSGKLGSYDQASGNFNLIVPGTSGTAFEAKTIPGLHVVTVDYPGGTLHCESSVPWGVAPGDRIRVHRPEFEPTSGILQEINPRELFLKVAESPEQVSIPLWGIERLEVSEGTKRKTLTGGLIGIALGVVIGGVIFDTADAPTIYGETTEEGQFLVGAVVGAAGGFLIGCLVGSAFASEKWGPAPAGR